MAACDGALCESLRHAAAVASAPIGAVIRNCLRVFTSMPLSCLKGRYSTPGQPVLPAGRRTRMRNLASDVRYALRLFLKRPGFAAVAILTLALGIGATTAIFTVVNAVLLSPLPFRDAERLAQVRIISQNGEGFPLPDADFLEWRAQNRTADAIAVYDVNPATITGGGEPERIGAAGVTDRFFDVLGARPLHRPPLPGRRRQARRGESRRAEPCLLGPPLSCRSEHRRAGGDDRRRRPHRHRRDAARLPLSAGRRRRLADADDEPAVAARAVLHHRCRTAEAGRLDRRAVRESRIGRARDQTAIPGARRLDARSGSAAGSAGRRRAKNPVPPAGRGRLPAAHRDRERRQPPARQSGDARARDRRPRRPRRRPRAASSRS